MNSTKIVTRLQTLLFSNAVKICGVLLCAMLSSLAANAQQQQEVQPDPEVSRIANANSSTNAWDDGLPTRPSRDDKQVQSRLPNAPSASKADLHASSLTLSDRFHIYGHTLLRPYSIVGPALGAGIGQWEDEPPEWGQGANGYAHRIGSGMARQFISETIRFGVAAADGEDPRYHRSQDSGVWNRARHAIVETFTSETASGSRIPAYSRFAGTYGAAFISNAWYPDSRATAGYALRRGSTALASSIGFHLFEEFMPLKYFKAINPQK